ncbi:MAG: T9SS type A sorting domain-containing protein [Bacteroidales bacterium]|nr:T9SS type A sorting domain-containing protein [Bacteroidales bacterium]
MKASGIKLIQPTLILLAMSILCTTTSYTYAQEQLNVLFIGNSYTEVNNLPKMTADIAQSRGNNITWSSNTPGGCTFYQHCSNNSMTLIRQGRWDVVVLQEQSQYPSFPQSQVENEVFPYAKRLVDSVYANNPCAEPMFYMTWGRKNGDQGNAPVFPVLGTYEGMDSMLCLRYTYMAESNDASLCPVGRVWHYLRDNNPDIELYQSDESHPSTAGTYAAACAFYTMFFGDDPELIQYTPDGINLIEATAIRQAAKAVVYTRLDKWKRPEPQIAVDTLNMTGANVTLVAHTQHADSIEWRWGDGETETTSCTDSIIEHIYAENSEYTVTTSATRHCLKAEASILINIAVDQDSTAVGIVNILPTTATLVVNPNPTETKPHVIISGESRPLPESDITIIMPDGRAARYDRIDFDLLPAGVYMLRIQTQKGTLSTKLIKK